MKNTANQDLRNAAKAAKVPLWRIAEKLGCSEPTMTRKLRRELPEKQKQQMFGIIEHLAMEESDDAEI
ncbi:MAG: hypothetical protein UD575_18270 [Oscillospiraceae bacterium]|jgi:hypothetical protein|nr:hypothetical protein [Oscillospiraceae bacterium]